MSEQAIEHVKPQVRHLSIIDVRRFYWNEFIVIYDILNANLKQLPSELHFEIAAAFDHLMRTDILDPSDAGYQESMEKSVGHLKRATFDGFKLLFKYPIRQRWLQLTHPRYNDVDNGRFVPQVESLWKEAREIVCAARAKERLSRRDDPIVWNAAFAEWKKLLPILRKLDELAESEGAKRARRKYIRSICGAVFLFLLGFVATKGLEWIYALAEKWIEK